MKRIRHRRLGWPVLRKGVFINSILVLFMASLVSFLTMNTLSRNLTEDVQQSAETMTEQAYNSANILLSSTFDYFGYQFNNNLDIFNAMYQNDFSPVESKKISDLLISLKASNPLIDSIYVYNLSHNMVFSSDLVYSTVDDFFDTGMSNILQHSDFKDLGIFIPRKVLYTRKAAPHEKAEKNVISLIYSNVKIKGDFDGALVVNLSQATLREIVAQGDYKSYQQSIIINKQGTVISHNRDDLINQHWGDRPYIARMMNANPAQGQFNEKVDGDKYLISYFKSDQLGWIFITMSKTDSIMTKVKLVQGFIFGITGLFLLIAAVIALLSIRTFYIPLRTIISRMGITATQSQENHDLNEFVILETWLRDQEKKVLDMKNIISGYAHAGKKELLKEIVSGKFSNPSGIEGRCKELGIQLSGEHFMVGLIRIDRYTALMNKFQHRDIMLFKFGIMNIAEETMQAYCTIEIFDDAEDTILFILNLDGNAPDMADYYFHAFSEVQNNVRRYMKMPVTISTGSMVPGIEEIKYSWNQAYVASKYRITHGISSVIPYTAEMSRQQTVHEYPYHLEAKMMDMMKLGSKAKHQEHVSDFFNEISRFHYEEIILFLRQMILMTERTTKTMISDDELLHTELFTLSELLQQWDTLDDIKEQYMQICAKIISFRDSESSQRVAIVTKRIKEHIHEEYANPNLTIDDLVRDSGMSKNHARKVFQDQHGESISDYVSRYRFEKAKQLLVQTDLSAARIGELVGMSSANYFYVSFKKHEGKSPLHYRTENKADRHVKD